MAFKKPEKKPKISKTTNTALAAAKVHSAESNKK